MFQIVKGEGRLYLATLSTGKTVDIKLSARQSEFPESVRLAIVEAMAKAEDGAEIAASVLKVNLDEVLTMFPGSTKGIGTGEKPRAFVSLNGETIAKDGDNWQTVVLRAEKAIEALNVWKGILPQAIATMEAKAKAQEKALAGSK